MTDVVLAGKKSAFIFFDYLLVVMRLKDEMVHCLAVTKLSLQSHCFDNIFVLMVQICCEPFREEAGIHPGFILYIVVNREVVT